ncbi:hypothetical protein [Paenibacillus sp. GYB003]|uniref:hypothetical protein n=1 Tax=Paenibacillus sp. GYB003 TaxID=2994392 RepID=UPI002F965140
MKQADTETYVKLLERWVKGAEPYIYACPDRPELACYGTGENGWGVQTNQKAFAAFGIAATSPLFDERRAGVSRDTVLDIALKLLRFSLHTHKEGTYPCTDGGSWGHTWISVLGTERMMHAVQAIEPHLTDDDRSLLRSVMLSESEWLLDRYDVAAGLYAKDGTNRPESNLWNGVFLHRTAAMYPDAPRAEAFREKGSTFLVNSISVPEDAECGEMVDGKQVSDRFVGANFFPSFGLNHHGYLNVGYMVICLSNMAMYHFACRSAGFNPPESLYRHGRELWELVKLCTFPDGRLLRIGGDTRVRYTYCQDYVIPVWLMMADLAGDADGLRFESGWLAQIAAEMDASGDGTFLSHRCRALRQQSPLYYTRLESDRACALSMGLAWRDLALRRMGGGTAQAAASAASPARIRSAGAWRDEYHGAYLHRSERRIASWVWDSAEKPQGLCLPPDASDMAEWRENMAGRLQGLGRSEARLQRHDGRAFEGGFLTWGSTVVQTGDLLAEGQKDEKTAECRYAVAALPDDVHMIVLHQAKALKRRTYVGSVKGLHLLIPNDVFNGSRRTYYSESGTRTVAGAGGKAETVRTGSRWLNADDRLGVIAAYGTDEIAIVRPGRRQIGLKDSAKTAGLERTLYADEICGPCKLETQSFEEGRPMLDTGYVIQSGETKESTARYATDRLLLSVVRAPSADLRGVRLRGADGRDYMLTANFGDIRHIWRIALPGNGIDVATGERVKPGSAGEWELELAPGAARLLRIVP